MYKITAIEGDGIGPEIIEATTKVIDAANVSIQWDFVNAGMNVYEQEGVLVPERVFDSIEKNKVAIKGPITTPIGKGFSSINVMLRKKYDLFSCVRPVKSIPGINVPFKNIDLVIFRENTEDLYVGTERMIDQETAEAIKIISKPKSDRIIRAAYKYASENNKSKVTVAHKANIMKLCDGLFLQCARDIAKEYPNIELQEVIIDNMCMQLVLNPSQFQVIVTSNLYGDILSDLCAGLVGGLGVVPGGNIGKNIAIFEAVHGSAPDITGKNIANPTALILTGAMMLEYLGEKEKAGHIRKGLLKTIEEGKYITRDLGGTASTSEMTKAIIYNMEAI